MFFFDFNLYLVLSFGGAILYSYQNHYKNPLIYGTSERDYLAAIILGIVAAGSSLALQLGLKELGLPENAFNTAFFYSALIEEVVKCLSILFLLWYFRIREVLYDGIYYGVVVGGAFGFVENTFYSSILSFWPLMLRTITSLVLHMLNGGIFGYFCMKFLFTEANYKSWFKNNVSAAWTFSFFDWASSSNRRKRFLYLLEGFGLAYISHGVYNYFGFIGGKYLMLLPLILVYNFILVEFIGAYSKSSLPKFALDLIELSIQDYELIRRYTKYELWLYNEQKFFKKTTNLFQKVSLRRSLYILFCVILSICFLILYFYFPEIRKSIFKKILLYEYISIFIIYPFMIAISVLFGGLVNPEFFQRQVLRVPLICVLDLKTKQYQETTMVFYLTGYGFYAPFVSPELLHGELELNFIIGTKEFTGLKGLAIWINENRDEPISAKSRFSVSGALIRFNSYPLSLILYWKWARSMLRLRNFFNLI
ncbi:MAG: PrsW family intramembrane metalloprotease [Leptospiraceae bacterium]|nr:PrsW family intramembrane metalloprotease [Leptospiraceae bacterium]